MATSRIRTQNGKATEDLKLCPIPILKRRVQSIKKGSLIRR